MFPKYCSLQWIKNGVICDIVSFQDGNTHRRVGGAGGDADADGGVGGPPPRTWTMLLSIN